MSQKKETLVLILALLITGGLLGIGYWGFTKSPLGENSSITDVSPSPSSTSEEVIPNLISSGEKRLVLSRKSSQKEVGIAAFASGNYEQAITNLEQALKQNRNDPEALIYLNNARIKNQKSYTIAVAVPIGESPNIAQEILRGVAQAQQEINQAGGIDGVPLRVMIADDKNKTQTAKGIAEALVKNQEILGVVGHFSSSVSIAAESVYEEGKLVIISPTSTSVQLSSAGDYFFRTVPSDRFAGRALAEYVIEQLNRTKAIVFFNRESDYSTSLKDEFTTAIYGDGGEVVAVFDLSKPNFDPFKAWDEATQKGADVIALFPDAAALEKTLQVVRVNRKKLPIVAGDDVYQLDTLKVGGDTEGMVVAVPWHILANSNSNFKQAATKLWGGDVNWRTAMAYDATQALIGAIAENPTRAGVQQALSASNFSVEGATGLVKFLPSGDRNQAVQLVTIEPGTRSGQGYDFVPVP